MTKGKIEIHPATKRLVAEDRCPKCRGELDTGWECNDCGFDAIELAHGRINGEITNPEGTG